MTHPKPTPPIRWGETVTCEYNPTPHGLQPSCVRGNPQRFTASKVPEVTADRAGSRGPGGMSARQPVARHPHTVMVPGRTMPDYWTSEGPYTTQGERRPGGERWIGHRAGDGAHVLVLVPREEMPPPAAGGLAFRCHFAPEYCDQVTRWRLERVGDAVVTWACDRHLVTVVEELQRPNELTEVHVTTMTGGSSATRRAG
jgi:hypothetical protein